MPQPPLRPPDKWLYQHLTPATLVELAAAVRHLEAALGRIPQDPALDGMYEAVEEARDFVNEPLHEYALRLCHGQATFADLRTQTLLGES
jgi:hypothetical protein